MINEENIYKEHIQLELKYILNIKEIQDILKLENIKEFSTIKKYDSLFEKYYNILIEDSIRQYNTEEEISKEFYDKNNLIINIETDKNKMNYDKTKANKLPGISTIKDNLKNGHLNNVLYANEIIDKLNKELQDEKNGPKYPKYEEYLQKVKEEDIINYMDNKIKDLANKDIEILIKENYFEGQMNIRELKEEIDKIGCNKFSHLYELFLEILGDEDNENVILNMDGIKEIFSMDETFKKEFREFFLFKKKKENYLKELKAKYEITLMEQKEKKIHSLKEQLGYCKQNEKSLVTKK